MNTIWAAAAQLASIKITAPKFKKGDKVWWYDLERSDLIHRGKVLKVMVFDDGSIIYYTGKHDAHPEKAIGLTIGKYDYPLGKGRTTVTRLRSNASYRRRKE